MFNNNKVLMTGHIVSDLQYSHEVMGEKFYLTKIEIARLSDNKDCIPMVVSDRLINVEEDLIGQLVNIIGQFRSHRNNNKLELFVFVQKLAFMDESTENKDENKISLDGYLCQSSKYRVTPLGREIADALLAVNRSYGKSDYIPCILWGRNAHFISELDIGSHIKIKGRIQSREYVKKINENESETRTAYEVSAAEVFTLED